jgi:hypothetical protein
MTISFVDIATIVAYAALAVDLLMQIHRVWIRKHSADVSILGECVRVTAAAVIFIKLLLVRDPVLILGHVIIVALLVVYIALLIRFRKTV